MAERDDTERSIGGGCSESPAGGVDGDIVRLHLSRAWQSWAPAPDLDARVRARLTSSSAATLGAIGLTAASRAGRPGPWASLQATGKLGALVGAGLLGVGFLSGYLAHPSSSPGASRSPEARAVAAPAAADALATEPEAGPTSGVSQTPGAMHPWPMPPPSASTGVPHQVRAAGGREPTQARRAPASVATSPAVRATGEPPSGASPAPNEEIALLQRAERAVRAGNAALALALIAELDTRHPRSALLEERSAIELLAHCRAGATDASTRGARFLRQHPQSLYGGRIRESCLAEAADSAARP